MSPTSCRCSTPRPPMVWTARRSVKSIDPSAAASRRATRGPRATGTEVVAPGLTNDRVASTHRRAHRAGHVRTPPHHSRHRAHRSRCRVPRTPGRPTGDVAHRAPTGRSRHAANPPRRLAGNRASGATRSEPAYRLTGRRSIGSGARFRWSRHRCGSLAKLRPGDDERERGQGGHDDREQVERQADVDLGRGARDQ